MKRQRDDFVLNGDGRYPSVVKINGGVNDGAVPAREPDDVIDDEEFAELDVDDDLDDLDGFGGDEDEDEDGDDLDDDDDDFEEEEEEEEEDD